MRGEPDAVEFRRPGVMGRRTNECMTSFREHNPHGSSIKSPVRTFLDCLRKWLAAIDKGDGRDARFQLDQAL